MLLVYGPRSTDYDFGPAHPLTPRRFGPGLDLLRAVGAQPGLAPEPASDLDLQLCHSRHYLDVVKRFSADPFGFPEAGIGDGGDNAPFADMHEAAAAVAGGSLRAVEAILRGDVEHAQHPGGGLHHAMVDHASGFCIYDDPALAIARARRDGLRVLYIDLDVHHGDGVQALHWSDPGVLTVSIHESGRTLFPGTGDVAEVGGGSAAGTAVNVPLPAGTGADAWIAILRSLLPGLTASFGPDLIVSQHGADSHAWDPLAHLNVTATAMGEAARLVDALAHAHAGGRWLATGGGGYDAYRVVPRAWALTWLAGAHREVPPATPVAWRDRWAAEAARYGQAPLPSDFDDPSVIGPGPDDPIQRHALEIGALVRRVFVPRLVREACDRGWLDPLAATPDLDAVALPSPSAMTAPTVLPDLDAAAWDRLELAPRVVPPASPALAHALVAGALADGARVTAAVIGSAVVGLLVVGPAGPAGERGLLALGVAPAFRRRGIGRALVETLRSTSSGPITAEVTLAERDVVEPLEPGIMASVAAGLLAVAGFTIEPSESIIRRVDPHAITAARPPGGGPST
ncbi:MAG: acetoin utilization AcuC family protein [Chloroflexota bacterium]